MDVDAALKVCGEVLVAVVTAVASCVGALAWPILVLILVDVFKDSISGGLTALSRRIDSLKGFGAEATFGPGVQRLLEDQKEAAQAQVTSEDATEDAEEEKTANEMAGERSSASNAAGEGVSAVKAIANIVTVLMPIEKSVEELYRMHLRLTDSASARMSVPVALSAVLRHLTEAGVISPFVASQIRDLQSLRDKALHDGYQPTLLEMSGFKAAADRILRELRSAGRRLGHGSKSTKRKKR